MTETIELTSIVRTPLGELREVRHRVEVPGELLRKLHDGTLFRDDVILEAVDVESGQVVELIDLGNLVACFRFLPWRSDADPNDDTEDES